MNNYKTRLSIIAILAVVSAAMTLFAPLANETTQGLFDTYSRSVSLFSGSVSEVCIFFVVVACISFVLFAGMSVFAENPEKNIVGTRISGIILILTQIIAIGQSKSFFDDRSLFGAIRSSVSDMSVHPIAIITVLLTFIAIILCPTISTRWKR